MPSPGASPAAAAPPSVPQTAAPTAAPAAPKPAPPAAPPVPNAPRVPSLGEIATPLAGVFYHAPAPGAPPFVEVGKSVEPGDQVGIVEVMKLMNSIKAPRKGRIREILVPNETLVAMGQVLMLMDPDPPAGQ